MCISASEVFTVLMLPAMVADPIPFPVWLVSHRELHTSRRVRVAFDLLADAFAKL